VLFTLALRGVICFGPNQANQATFVLLDDWLPKQTAAERGRGAGRASQAIFHRPRATTAQDFAWVERTCLTQAKAGLALAEPYLRSRRVASAHRALISCLGSTSTCSATKIAAPCFRPNTRPKIVPGGNGVFMSTMLVNGQVVGTWKRAIAKRGAARHARAVRENGAPARAAVERAAKTTVGSSRAARADVGRGALTALTWLVQLREAARELAE